ncbi:MAG: class I SAM-dependent methyltransferase [Planctomycetota bacterium]|jgi:2-polyprenyl-3-methyl-5-hydroxy-6-metoxy-1,4-benzoquinol methylase
MFFINLDKYKCIGSKIIKNPYSVNELITVPCPLCGSNESVLFGEERYLKTVKCSNCDMLYVNPRLSHEKLSNIYSNYYHKKDHWQKYIEDHSFESGGSKKTNKSYSTLWNKRFSDIWKHIGSHLPSTKTLNTLDVGAGTSDWSKWLKSEITESHCWVFDIADNPKMCDNDGVKSVVAKSIDKADLPEKHFDLITLFDVIEHYENPSFELKQIRRLLSDNGLLYIQTPNSWWIEIKYILQKLVPEKHLNKLISSYGVLLPEQHLQYYSLKNIIKQLKMCGFNFKANFNIDWNESSDNIISKLIYKLTYYQCICTSLISRHKVNTNIGLSIIAQKNDLH